MTALGADTAATIHVVNALNATAATAGGDGDETAANGATIDLAGLGSRFNGAAFAVRANATLAESETLTLAAKIEDSADGSNWADLVASASVLTLTGGAGGSTEAGIGVVGVDLRSADRYIRVVATPDLSASGTDTASVDAVCVLTGGDVLPVTA
jgi:hypothetical protein